MDSHYLNLRFESGTKSHMGQDIRVRDNIPLGSGTKYIRVSRAFATGKVGRRMLRSRAANLMKNSENSYKTSNFCVPG